MHEWEGQYLRDYLIPQQPPMLGHYSSRNPGIIRQHLKWMEACGIDVYATARKHGFTIDVVRTREAPQHYFGLVLID